MIAVIGLGFGDEGKGKVVNWLCKNHKSSNTIVVRFSGGHQAGHTVMDRYFSHVFSSFGSGTNLGFPTYISKYCVVSPIALLNELEVLKGKGVKPKIFIDVECPISTPYDHHFNENSNVYYENGTCGVGVGTTLQREDDHYSLLFGDLLFKDVLKFKLDAIREYYGKKYISPFPSHEEQITTFLTCCMKIKDICGSNDDGTINEVPFGSRNQQFLQKKHLIFEGSQGLLLDQHYGFFPNVTRSNTGLKNISKLVDFSNLVDDEVYYVTRAYQTRHGNGPMTELRDQLSIKKNIYETNKKNDWQGDFRVSLLDLDLLEYGLSREKVYCRKNLVVNHLDQMNEFKFKHDGEIHTFPSENEFVIAIRERLKLDGVYSGNTPYSELY